MSTPQLWQNIEQLMLRHPGQEADMPELPEPLPESELSRRHFLKLLSTSAALAAVAAGCRRPDHKLVPAVAAPEYQIPGLPLFYTTAFLHKNAAYGLLVKCREGRPIKVEGNDRHSVARGTSTAYAQALLYTLYDPDRIRRVRMGQQRQAPLSTALAEIAAVLQRTAREGKLCYLCVDDHASPTFEALLQQLQSRFAWLRVITLPSFLQDTGAMLNAEALGIAAEFVPHLGRVDYILCVEADPLGTDRYALWHIRNFAEQRRLRSRQDRMNRLVCVEALMTLTGTNADTRIRMHPAAFEGFLAAVLQEVARERSVPESILRSASQIPTAYADRARSIAQELLRAGDRAVVLVGPHLPAPVHALALAINWVLGSVGEGKAMDPAHVLPHSYPKRPGIEKLQEDIRQERVNVLLFANVNPEYTADWELRQSLSRVPWRVALSLYSDETAAASWIHIPVAHPLESWGDALSIDGTLVVQQPLIAPLNEGIGTVQDILIQLAKRVDPVAFPGMDTYYDFLRYRWQQEYGVSDARWEDVLREGVYTVSRGSPPRIAVDPSAIAEAIRPSGLTREELVAVALPSYALYDGFYANCPWLQEMPDPVTKLTWDNVAALSPGTAHRLGLRTEDLVQLRFGKTLLTLPVWVQPGMADGVIATSLGYGRTQGGEVLKGVGHNAYPLLPRQQLSYVPVELHPLGQTYPLAVTQRYAQLQGRPILRVASLPEYQSPEGPHFQQPEFPGYSGSNGHYRIPLTIVPPYEYKGHRWGMVIDLTTCTGCGACIIACQAENNIPTVGKDQVRRGREMHWLRIDRYYLGPVDDPRVVHQPMLCQHCENAPCENVCPVAATTHSPEGLNEMTYNRCVGTRYCLNNCPYKVRRFNFLDYHTDQRAPLEMLFNPDVTVRMRGIMEKCTFCVQRINEAKYHARDEGRERVRDGEVLTACQQACPAEAIVFGDLNDSTSRVAQLRRNDRGYYVLEELNVRPSITYLAKVWNAPTEEVYQLKRG
ncbi:MAG: 4Fe-4S dicluster domain-containing protein [Candidatus Kapabacteria bacterium]|nr:4Fe-4S dicluster domain-containing protein [Candidatus Kapabacteria bacterium]MCS7169523.1 4Fe-4S dicluster domain-containing protein [Candidatus Kapabacteria bacterium]MDW7996285.1 4Fe-4S dicluster domain-containing protein [Bacteroidota bacterium]MDW8226019.1 4Fe-4S dicluster domain-containing protein [Bacteroidota bacterium]